MGAYFLNRLHPSIKPYHEINGKLQAVDWKKIDSLIQKNRLPHLCIDVYLGKEKTVKAKMVIEPVPVKVAEKRIKTAGKRKEGYAPSKEYKIKSHYNIFITNIPEQMISLSQS